MIFPIAAPHFQHTTKNTAGVIWMVMWYIQVYSFLLFFLSIKKVIKGLTELFWIVFSNLLSSRWVRTIIFSVLSQCGYCSEYQWLVFLYVFMDRQCILQYRKREIISVLGKRLPWSLWYLKHYLKILLCPSKIYIEM